MTTKTGKVERIEYTEGGAGNQWTTIGGVRYATYWDIRTIDWRVGVSWQSLEGVTWSEDNATSHGVEYVRADLAAHPAAGAVPEEPSRFVRAVEYSNDFAGVRILRYPTEPAPAGEWVKTELSSAAGAVHGLTPVEMTRVLREAWAKAEPDHSITQHPESYVRTFYDMAVAACAALAATTTALPASRWQERYLKLRAWYLRQGTRAEIHPQGYIAITTPEIFDAGVDALPESNEVKP